MINGLDDTPTTRVLFENYVSHDLMINGLDDTPTTRVLFENYVSHGLMINGLDDTPTTRVLFENYVSHDLMINGLDDTPTTRVLFENYVSRSNDKRTGRYTDDSRALSNMSHGLKINSLRAREQQTVCILPKVIFWSETLL
ncbi:hypothetical protein EVAR_90552_1 [Eumeta japonica]|uniref:Uncharacterized protein n=1 Tax=Eumeta variegata TaxID=151549 RepID=A0A4C2ACY5_EUMVA|nr:hypothetical protein EVAR_90552_1 [Eumeta japonica]